MMWIYPLWCILTFWQTVEHLIPTDLCNMSYTFHEQRWFEFGQFEEKTQHRLWRTNWGIWFMASSFAQSCLQYRLCLGELATAWAARGWSSRPDLRKAIWNQNSRPTGRSGTFLEATIFPLPSYLSAVIKSSDMTGFWVIQLGNISFLK